MPRGKKKAAEAAAPPPEPTEEQKKAEEIKKWKKKLRTFINKNQMYRVLKALLSALLSANATQVGLTVDTELEPRTDGKTIWVSLLPSLLDKKWERFWGILFRPITAHEAQHCNSSDFEDVKVIREWYGDALEKEGFSKAIGVSIASDFHNAIEDGRIEQISANRHPGLVVPYRFLNDCIREGCTISEKADNPKEEYHDFFGQVLSYAKTGMYAPGCECYAGEEMENVFLATRGFIDSAVKARTSADCRLLTQSLLTDATPYLTKLLRDSEELRQELESQENHNEYEGATEVEFNEGDGSPENSVRAPTPAGHGQSPGGGEAGGEEGQVNYGFSGSSGTEEKGYTQNQIAEMEQALKESINAAEQQQKKEETPPEADGLNQKEVGDIVDEYYQGVANNFREEWMKYPDVPLPPDIQLEAMTLRKELTRLFKARKTTVYGRQRGLLDVKALWRVGMGAKDVFYQPGRKDAQSCAFYLLIDNSGSMASHCSPNVSKSFAARRAAAIIEEALKGIVPVKISLFMDSYDHTRHISLKGFDSKSKTNACYASLSVVQPDDGNADSIHIRVATKELLKRPERKKILFVLSDGMPSAYGCRESAEGEVKKAVDDARHKNVTVIPIMFGSEDFRRDSLAMYQRMYTKDILACDPNDISRQLPSLFRKLIEMN